MFKNVTIYRFLGQLPPQQVAESLLAKSAFVACGATQTKSVGWVPPRDIENSALLEVQGGQWIAEIQVETKAVPSQVLARHVQDIAESIQRETGRKPGRKKLGEVRDQVTQDLLPKAFPKLSRHPIWIDSTRGLVVVDCASAGRCDDIVSALVAGFPTLQLQHLHTSMSAASAMANWLMDSAPSSLAIDRDVELTATDESRAKVKYAHHALDIDEIRAHIEAGKHPTRLAMTWKGRVSFVLTEDTRIKRIAFDDVVFSEHPGDDDEFDADAAICTGELSALIDDLIEALGSELPMTATRDLEVK